MSFATLIYETEGPLAWITLNRPEKLNAISKVMVGELNLALDQAQADDQVRVILLKGEGRAFSAGFDLEPQAAPGAAPGQAREEELAALTRELHSDFDLIMRFWDCPKPTVAAIHGYCLGGALEMALACDITIAARGCHLGEPEVKFGSGIVAMLLPFLCGPKRAKELLLSGNDRVTAEQAEAWGLVNRVCDADWLVHEARALARQIARNDQLAVRLTKQAVNNLYEIPRMRDALRHALELDVAIETTETEESRAFNDILKKEGTRAAIAWRDRQFD
ncbi:MAG: enoyl-CoA hydratase/isomerase family protein [Xanthomonadales bacterium]|jgi:enoyl-CoA hydratase|nr:enoyl-CoA hydratase/isomerase family protein [Xanthomonadales bacterium]